jgi:sulfur dioxygenase
MLFRQLFDAASSTYSYLLADESAREAVLIDPVFEQVTRDTALVRELDLTLLYTLETHVHADHVTAGWLLRDSMGSRIGISRRSGARGADVLLDDGDLVRFGALSLRILSTPGHTSGCVTFVTNDERAAFTGDALLIRGAGRTDFQEGDSVVLFHSIRDRIFALPDDCLIYPGHDYAGRTVTTVAEEKRFNPRAGGDANERDFALYMQNLKLSHPKKIDVAVAANLRCGEPESGSPSDRPEWGPVIMTYAGIPEIDPAWVAEHRDVLAVVDVREADELAGPERRIDGSLHVPLGSLSARLSEIPVDRPVVLVCRSGRRSAHATTILRQAGRMDCANMQGGMLRWRGLGLPVR